MLAIQPGYLASADSPLALGTKRNASMVYAGDEIPMTKSKATATLAICMETSSTLKIDHLESLVISRTVLLTGSKDK
jgi:hypothetical protein